jgi:hypothetical protein
MIHRSILTAAFSVTAALALGGCFVGPTNGQPVAYSQPGYATYGYSTVQQPNQVYYSGGYHQGTYYQPGYYHPTAPFISASVSTGYNNGYAQPAPYVSSTGYAAPGVAASVNVNGGNGYAQPAYGQPVYNRPGYVGVGAAVSTPVVGGSVNGAVIAPRVGFPVP